jgi:hypothetical protein
MVKATIYIKNSSNIVIELNNAPKNITSRFLELIKSKKISAIKEKDRIILIKPSEIQAIDVQVIKTDVVTFNVDKKDLVEEEEVEEEVIRDVD